jgi:hypothetical protein
MFSAFRLRAKYEKILSVIQRFVIAAKFITFEPKID